MHFFDSYALIEILRGSPSYRTYSDAPLVTTALNLCETYYFFLREGKGPEFMAFYQKASFELLQVTADAALEAARFRHARRKQNFSYADSVSYAVARSKGLTFVTGDKEFKGLEGVEWVP